MIHPVLIVGLSPDGITDVPKGMRGIRRHPKKVLNVCQECWGNLPEEGPPLNCSYCGQYPICDTCSTDEMPYEAKSGKLTSRGSHSKICHRCRLRIKFDSESFSAERGCANCDKQSHFTHEDLPVGPRSFCSEKCWAEYVGVPTHPEGYYGFVGKDLSLSAESTNSQSSEELQKIQKELAVERTELSELRSEFSAKRTAMSGIRTILAIGTFILVVATFKHQTDKNS